MTRTERIKKWLICLKNGHDWQEFGPCHIEDKRQCKCCSKKQVLTHPWWAFHWWKTVQFFPGEE